MYAVYSLLAITQHIINREYKLTSMDFEKTQRTIDDVILLQYYYRDSGLGKIPEGCLMVQNSGTRDLVYVAWVKLMVPYNILYTLQVYTHYEYYICIRYYILYMRRG